MSMDAYPYPDFVSGTTIASAQVDANFAHARDQYNAKAMELAGTQTVTGAKTFSALVTASAGVAVTGNSTIAGTLGSVTTLSCTTVTASGAISAGSTVTVGTHLVMSGGQASLKYVNDGDSGTALTMDLNGGNWRRTRLTGNCTLTLSNPATGASYRIDLLQDATGSRTFTWPATVKWDGNVAPTLTTTASRKDSFLLSWNGSAYIGTTISMAVADTT